MGKRKLEMRRIACPKARIVCFSKRRQGLFKKAADFSRLFNVKVAAFAISPAGKLFEFGDIHSIINSLFPDIPSSSQSSASPSPNTSWISETQSHLDGVDISGLSLSELQQYSRELDKIKGDLLKRLENNSIRIGTDEGSTSYNTENHNDANYNDAWMAGMIAQDEDDTENHNDAWMAGMLAQDEDEDNGDISMTNEELDSILEGMRMVDSECPEAFGITQGLSFTDLLMGVNEVGETQDFFAGISADDYINELLSSS